MKCPVCGAENPHNNKYCGDCGEILLRPVTQPYVDTLSHPGVPPSPSSGNVRMEYIVGGGLTTAIFFGLFFWAINFTYTEQVWHELPYIGGYWTTVTHTIDPAIQAFLLVVAIVGLIAMVYGMLSRK